MAFDPGPTIPPMDKSNAPRQCEYCGNYFWVVSESRAKTCSECVGKIVDELETKKEPWRPPTSTYTEKAELRIKELMVELEGKDHVIEAQRQIIEELRAPKLRPGCAGYCQTHENDWIPLP